MTAATARKPRRTPEQIAAAKADLMAQLDAFVASLDDEDDTTAAVIAHLEERYSERN